MLLALLGKTTTLKKQMRKLRGTSQSKETWFYFVSRNDQREVENRPQWRGGLFDLKEDVSEACASFFCMFCVFGWNMERLRFGSMYVQTATFLIFCLAPFFVFSLASISIDNDVAIEAMGIIAILLSVVCVWSVGENFCRNEVHGNDHPPLSPLPRKGGVDTFRSNPSSLVWEHGGPSTLKIEDYHSNALDFSCDG
ncbi:hypothetical protein Ancab_031490 [Ancistrocladus abbreviatus]